MWQELCHFWTDDVKWRQKCSLVAGYWTVNRENLGMRFSWFSSDNKNGWTVGGTFYSFHGEMLSKIIARTARRRTRQHGIKHSNGSKLQNKVIRLIRVRSKKAETVNNQQWDNGFKWNRLSRYNTCPHTWPRHLLFGAYLQTWTDLYLLNRSIKMHYWYELTSTKVSMF